MKVKEFVDGYKAAEDKTEYMKSHVIRTYLPIAEKMKVARMAAESAYMIGGSYSPQRSIGELMFNIAKFEAYTDVEVVRVDEDGNVHTAEEYDMIAECGAINMLMEVVGYPEFWAFEEIYINAVDDIKEAETDTWAVLKKQATRISDVGGVIADAFAEQIRQALTPEEIRELFSMLKDQVQK